MKTTKEYLLSDKIDGHCKECGQEVPKLFRVCSDCSKLKIEGKPRLQLTGLSRTAKGWS